jgi:hypothetical protein
MENAIFVAWYIASCMRVQAARGLYPDSFGVTQRWEHSRFRDPYMREDLQDFGILTDTLECAVTWGQLKEVHERVRAFIKSRPRTICMTHLSHAYPQGANLYFIFIARMDSIQAYLELQYGILQAIQESGAAMSHHHGIGKQTGAWFAEQVGAPTVQLLQALKRHFDPDNILNPGGTLGLDMLPEQYYVLSWGQILLRYILLGIRITDTQCGFKAFPRQAALEVLQYLKVYHPARQGAIQGPSVTSGFDVEFLMVANRLGYPICEIRVQWNYQETRRVSLVKDAVRGMRDLIRIAWVRLIRQYPRRRKRRS